MEAQDQTHKEALAVLLDTSIAEALIKEFVSQLTSSSTTVRPESSPTSDAQLLSLGLAALEAFLQANVTGPVLPANLSNKVDQLFLDGWRSVSEGSDLDRLRKQCLEELKVDGVAPYAYIPNLELFALARYILQTCLSKSDKDTIELSSAQSGTAKHSIVWTRLRLNAWHYKLITQPSLGHGSNFTRSSQWSEVPTLGGKILDGIEATRRQVLNEEIWAEGTNAWSNEDQVLFLVEAANYYILLGRNDLAKDMLSNAAAQSGLEYALSGALGKRTKFQEKSTSQLVVLAKSKDATSTDVDEAAKPEALQLNNDTLLEEISFEKEADQDSAAKIDSLSASLAALSPDDQPQLSPLDQIILLTEATMKDAFSPVDTLTSEKILPYAVRVLADKSTNWQIYTQALLVRSRIEVHRSRTLERGVLQLQAVADQVIADTTSQAASQTQPPESGDEVPSIQVTLPDQQPAEKVATSFLPAPKPSESAPAHVRLQYIHALSSPPRWHLESELAYAWAGVGSLASALEIFKRLRLWAEVALCLASRGAAAEEDTEGRGSGGEAKAKGIVRWRLFHRTDTTSPTDPDEETIEDVAALQPSAFTGPERVPPPPDAPRLWCILGDLESNPDFYRRAWDISHHRYARAQRSLAEHHTSHKDWLAAREAYIKATAVNRLDTDMWSRLGDLNLRLGRFEDAAESYTRAIAAATDLTGGEGAKTWSNLGSALWSLYCEVIAKEPSPATSKDEDEEEDQTLAKLDSTIPANNPPVLLTKALAAYKRGASIAHSNWRIWDNVLTLAARLQPPAVPDMVQALSNIIRIRTSEDCVDSDILTLLLKDVVLSAERQPGREVDGIYEPPRGSMERLVARLIEEDIVPIITHRSDLWSLTSQLRAWRRDYVGAVEASERAWRTATTASSTLTPGEASKNNWTEDKEAWEVVVQRTDELASALENYGPEVDSIGPKWKGKVRSAVRSVMGRGKENWEDTEGWQTLQGIMDGLKA
ncbi:uncharacterized protein F5Z01DRAFT_256523 [Emericellopsis atlantica]|uniref:TPR repeat-containing protein n=1 Tax=Emericellopsis atlantica TaxID=2614577 RepID=A0A9P7ZHQ6_9HYPO|nr:uncharacterized protein F5Z01DRAFT_256523 [Emericellopsis atlantica]KAG9251882.1 hypothetical protein F5Z01DRAFT_256523 [Emericellopsis atlantica]